MKGEVYGMPSTLSLAFSGELSRVVIGAAGDLAGSRMDRLDHRGFRRAVILVWITRLLKKA